MWFDCVNEAFQKLPDILFDNQFFLRWKELKDEFAETLREVSGELVLVRLSAMGDLRRGNC